MPSLNSDSARVLLMSHNLSTTLISSRSRSVHGSFMTERSGVASLTLRAIDPSVVGIESPVSILPLRRMGRPWSGPRTMPESLSASSLSAIAKAWLFSERIDRSQQAESILEILSR